MSTQADVVAVAPSFTGPEWSPGRSWFDVRGLRQGTAEDVFWVKQAELADALDIIDGVPEVLSIGSPVATITRNVPLEHWLLPNCYCDGYRVEIYRSAESPIDGVDFTGPYAKITVQYKQLDYSINGDDAYQRVSARGFSHEIPVDSVAFADGSTPSYSVNRLVPGLSYRLTVFDAPGVTESVEAAWASAAGSVNAHAFRGNAAGTVLYHSPEFDYITKRDGSRTCTYTLSFDVLRVPWNSAYKRDGSIAAYTVGGSSQYPSIDFGQLFY